MYAFISKTESERKRECATDTCIACACKFPETGVNYGTSITHAQTRRNNTRQRAQIEQMKTRTCCAAWDLRDRSSSLRKIVRSALAVISFSLQMSSSPAWQSSACIRSCRPASCADLICKHPDPDPNPACYIGCLPSVTNFTLTPQSAQEFKGQSVSQDKTFTALWRRLALSRLSLRCASSIFSRQIFVRSEHGKNCELFATESHTNIAEEQTVFFWSACLAYPALLKMCNL